jgi:signal transduction histidine kinase
MACLFLIFCSFIYFALVSNIEAEDFELINAKIKIVLPQLESGDPTEIRSILGERYSLDLRKRVYVAIYDNEGLRFDRSFNANSPDLNDIFPQKVDSHWKFLEHSSSPEKIFTKNKIMFNLSTLKVVDRYGKSWVMRVAVDHDTEERILGTVGFSFLGLFIILVVAVPASSGLVTHLMMKPLLRLSSALEQMTLGHDYAPIDVNLYPKEFLGLVTTFNGMSQNAAQSFNRLESFSADIAHELRNPLNSLRGSLELIQEKPRSIPEYRETLDSILEDVHRLCRLVDRLLFLLRGERKLLKTKMSDIPLLPLVMKLKDLYEPMVQENNGAITYQCEPGLSAYGEPYLLQRALINLVENAIKYGRPRDPQKPQLIEITVAASKETKNHIDISVIDNGPGIISEEKPYVFDRLFRSDRARDSQGYGLGLAIVKMITELHEGHVEVESTPDQGCRFRLTLLTGPAQQKILASRTDKT